jgi:hypothetical protein
MVPRLRHGHLRLCHLRRRRGLEGLGGRQRVLQRPLRRLVPWEIPGKTRGNPGVGWVKHGKTPGKSMNISDL